MIKNRDEALELCDKVNRVIGSCDMHNKSQLSAALKYSILAAKQLHTYKVDYIVKDSFEDLCSALGYSYSRSMLKKYILYGYSW